MTDRERAELLIQELLAQKKDKFEALSWLKAGNEKSYRNLAEWTNEESINLIEQLYACGAEEVWAVRLDRNPPYESINTLIVTVPDDSKTRRTVFRWINRHVEQQGFAPEEDYGQQHVHVWFD